MNWPSTFQMKGCSMYQSFFLFSLIHAVYSTSSFVAICVCFILRGYDSMRLRNQYRSDTSDVRSAFNPVLLTSGWAILAIISLWDHFALGAVLAAINQRQNTDNEAKDQPLPFFMSVWCCKKSQTNERLTDICHGMCDRRYGRLILITARMAILGAVLTISAMTVTARSEDETVGNEYRKVYTLAAIIAVTTIIETPMSICGSVLHSAYTYYWISNWHHIEIMAMEMSQESLSQNDDSAL